MGTERVAPAAVQQVLKIRMPEQNLLDNSEVRIQKSYFYFTQLNCYFLQVLLQELGIKDLFEKKTEIEQNMFLN